MEHLLHHIYRTFEKRPLVWLEKPAAPDSTEAQEGAEAASEGSLIPNEWAESLQNAKDGAVKLAEKAKAKGDGLAKEAKIKWYQLTGDNEAIWKEMDQEEFLSLATGGAVNEARQMLGEKAPANETAAPSQAEGNDTTQAALADNAEAFSPEDRKKVAESLYQDEATRKIIGGMIGEPVSQDGFFRGIERNAVLKSAINTFLANLTPEEQASLEENGLSPEMQKELATEMLKSLQKEGIREVNSNEVTWLGEIEVENKLLGKKPLKDLQPPELLETLSMLYTFEKDANGQLVLVKDGEDIPISSARVLYDYVPDKLKDVYAQANLGDANLNREDAQKLAQKVRGELNEARDLWLAMTNPEALAKKYPEKMSEGKKLMGFVRIFQELIKMLGSGNGDFTMVTDLWEDLQEGKDITQTSPEAEKESRDTLANVDDVSVLVKIASDPASMTQEFPKPARHRYTLAKVAQEKIAGALGFTAISRVSESGGAITISGDRGPESITAYLMKGPDGNHRMTGEKINSAGVSSPLTPENQPVVLANTSLAEVGAKLFNPAASFQQNPINDNETPSEADATNAPQETAVA